MDVVVSMLRSFDSRISFEGGREGGGGRGGWMKGFRKKTKFTASI